MRAAFVLGRAIFGGFFAYSGINHFKHRAQLSAYANAKGTPAPDAAVLATGAMLLGGGASVITGVEPRRGLAALVGFLIPVSLQMHRFWEIEDPMQRQNELIHFSKNIALAGAALALMQIPEPWPASVGRRRIAVRKTYPRFTPRELRSLPA
jgi:putative oxidoreductase